MPEMDLRRFWIEFDLSGFEMAPIGALAGCGVTASDMTNALQMLRNDLFAGRELPPVRRIIEDVDISSLDAHVRPNMRNPTERGVWFPLF